MKIPTKEVPVRYFFAECKKTLKMNGDKRIAFKKGDVCLFVVEQDNDNSYYNGVPFTQSDNIAVKHYMQEEDLDEYFNIIK